jgi:predicted Fe-Mo cluster-binding NifX family protein
MKTLLSSNISHAQKDYKISQEFIRASAFTFLDPDIRSPRQKFFRIYHEPSDLRPETSRTSRMKDRISKQKVRVVSEVRG